jgi:hypothetical protein
MTALALAGCGNATSSTAVDSSSSSGPTSSTTSPSASTLPACASIWQAGKKLPADYTGCNNGAHDVKAHRIGCSSGQTMVLYTKHYYAVLGGTIHHSTNILRDKSYLHSISVCRG